MYHQYDDTNQQSDYLRKISVVQQQHIPVTSTRGHKINIQTFMD
jgi:hypothetical protein